MMILQAWIENMKLGKIGKINQIAKRKLIKLYRNKGIRYCEARIPGICNGMYTTFAHRHSRIWYRNQSKLLSSFGQTILICQACHTFIDHPLNKKFKEGLFLRLRGEENT